MSQSSKSLLLADEISLLVRHFGIQQVRAALAKAASQDDGTPRVATRGNLQPRKRSIRTNGGSLLAPIREVDPEKHLLLSEFLLQLRDRHVLPESQDIRHFAQIIGLKEITGRSREEMIPKLMRFLIEQPIEKLRADIRSASNISEEQRQMGFSVLTDKLLGRS
jgi:hypothetical protein